MKIFVFTDQQGNVIGSFRPKEPADPGAPTFKPEARSMGKVHEIDLPAALASVKDPVRLHQELGKLVGKR